MQVIVKRSFPKAVRVPDKFYVQKLATEAMKDFRIKHRWEALDLENNLIERARSNKTEYKPEIHKNGDTLMQLLARSRYFLYKSRDNWTESQKHRAEILFYRYPDIEIAYNLSADLWNIFNKTKDKVYALAKWQSGTRMYDKQDLNYFNNRSTNASAESFKRGVAPSKIKAFRSQFRGVRNVEYYLFRLDQIYA
jgi:transposase